MIAKERSARHVVDVDLAAGFVEVFEDLFANDSSLDLHLAEARLGHHLAE